MSSIFETLAKASADYLHSQSLNAERAETIRAAILRQWKERDEPKATHLSQTTGIGTYTMVFEYEPPLEKEEFAQLIPEELKDVPGNKGSVFVWWGAHAPSKYEIHLTFETPRNLRLNELKEARKKEEKAKEKIDPVDYGGEFPSGSESEEDHGVPFESWDTSLTYTRPPKGYHFIDDEGHISPKAKHGGSGKKRGRDNDKSEAEKGAENVQAIMDDYAKDEATVANGVAAKRVRIENLKTRDALNIMDDALEVLKVDGYGWSKIENKQGLALLWERALLNDITHDAHCMFNKSIQLAESADNDHLTWP